MKTLKYLFNCWWKTVKRGNPNKRAFFNFLNLFKLEIECLFMTGRTIDEL